MQKSVVLVTSAVMPPEGIYRLKMTNFAPRLITTKAAVFFFAGLGAKRICIADATGFTLLNEDEVRLLSDMDCEVEQISYSQNNNLVIQKGKGFGEGELIKFALQKSILINNSGYFFKCTGKVYCSNFPIIQSIIQENKLKHIFWRDIFHNSVDTRFFYTSIDFAKKHLIQAYENINDRENNMAEEVVTRLCQRFLTPSRSIRPQLTGFSGSLNKPYFNPSMGYLDQNLPCWISQ